MAEEFIIYEQPINEYVRACLRLERLFEQADHACRGKTVWDARNTISVLLEILYLLDRPDLKTKITKELCRFIANFSKLEQKENVDTEKLKNLLQRLESINDALHHTQGRIAQALRQNQLLETVQHYARNPGGVCAFEVPSYHLWLHKPTEERAHDLKKWLSEFDIIKEAICLLLCLIRESSEAQTQIAEQGFFQMSLGPQVPCQLVRLLVSIKDSVFPETSVGRHGVFVRFFDPKYYERPAQTKKNLTFKMACCIL